MRHTATALVFVTAVACGSCGGSSDFAIDNVTVSPTVCPFDPSGTLKLTVGAQVFDGLHVVNDVWVQTADGKLYLPLIETADPQWGISEPLSVLDGLAVGTYSLDIHATDDGGRAVSLTAAISITIQP